MREHYKNCIISFSFSNVNPGLFGKSESHSVVSNSSQTHGLYSPWNSPGWPGVGSLSLFQGIFPIQGSNPVSHIGRWILYQLSHKVSPRILEWIAYPFSSGSSQPGIVSCIAGGFFTNWAIREAQALPYGPAIASLVLIQRTWKLLSTLKPTQEYLY